MLALTMLILGETLLRGSLRPITYVLYWLVCFVLTGIALLLGAIDAHAVRKRTAQEQRELFEGTLREIQEDAVRKQRKNL